MTTRERWIVYPLLFLALGIALRNQFLPTKKFGAMDLKAADLTAQTIHCNNIEIMQEGKCQNLEFGSAQGKRLSTGYAESIQSKTGEADFQKITVSDDKEKPVILMGTDPTLKAGKIITMTASGAPQVILGSNTVGGTLSAIGHLGRLQLMLGHEEKVSGLFGLLPQGFGNLLTTPWPMQFKMPPGVPKSEQMETPKKDETK
jgi:hypothetical protein